MLQIFESFIIVNIYIFMPATFILGFIFNIKESNFFGVYKSIKESQNYGDFKSYITLYLFYIVNTWLFIIFLPARFSNMLIELTKLKESK